MTLDQAIVAVALYHILFISLQSQLIVVIGGTKVTLEAFSKLPWYTRLWYFLSCPYIMPLSFYSKLLRGKRHD